MNNKTKKNSTMDERQEAMFSMLSVILTQHRPSSDRPIEQFQIFLCNVPNILDIILA